MYSFFVLGWIPGTTIQISFSMWIEATAALFLLILLGRKVWKRRHAVLVLPPTISPEFDYFETTQLIHSA